METPKFNHPPIKMRRSAKDGFWDRTQIEVGDYYWRVDDKGRRMLCVIIPCKTAEGGQTFSQWTIDYENACGAKWSWDGNVDAPTLTPSLHAVGVWHGFVRNGELVEA